MRRAIYRLTVLTAMATLVASMTPVAHATADGAVSADAPTQTLELANPSGTDEVGSTTLHLVDRSRPDPWVSSAAHRELMVSLHYPTWTPFGRDAQYMTPAESKAFIRGQREQGVPIPDDIPGSILSKVRTNATADVPPAPSVDGHPLVVLSPGFSLSRGSLTGLATELASKGYVVATVDHTYESFGIELPGGRLATCAACDVEDYSTIPRIRSRDISFVLDRLLSRRSPWPYGWTIDRDRIGLAGHSIGGNSASTTMVDDPRIDAGANLDGTFFDPIGHRLERPFMMLGTRQLHTPNGEDESWSRDWRKLDGPRYWFTVAGSGHFSFIDYPPLTDQLGIENPSPLTGERSMRITRTLVGAFFDRHLRGRSRPVLDDPAGRFEDVAAHTP